MLSADEVREVLLGLAPVLGFLLAATVVAELADGAGVFDAAARLAARWGRGSVLRLWLLVVVVATLTTVLLSLDTTAVLLTPVVLGIVRRAGLPAAAFALTVVWLANTASLLLPVSNLTNLLVQQRTGVGSASFAARMWLPSVTAVVVTVVVIGVRYRRDLTGRYTADDDPPRRDPVLFPAGVVACAAIGPLVLLGVPAVWAAGVAALVLVAAYLVRRPAALRALDPPWLLMGGVAVLFVAVAAIHRAGLDRALLAVAGQGDGPLALLQIAGVGAVLSNAVNNLPAYALLEPVADTLQRSLALLIGVNLGPLVTAWGSLATLLWRQRCRASGIDVGWREFATLGLVGVPVLVVTATVALAIAPGA